MNAIQADEKGFSFLNFPTVFEKVGPTISKWFYQRTDSTAHVPVLTSSSSSLSSYLYLPSDFRVAYAASISEHLPTQPWEYTHKDQTTTPGTTSPTLRTVSGFFNVPQSY